jgi:hypothetical protein
MWEVIEHIAESDLAVVAENVRAHLKTNGLWIMSVSPNEEIINGVRLHQTVQQKPWWIETFKRLGFVNLESLVRYFNGQFVRGPKQNAPGSFHLVLTLNPASAPSAPRLRCRDYIYDCWLYSKPQKLLRLLVGNIAG